MHLRIRTPKIRIQRKLQLKKIKKMLPRTITPKTPMKMFPKTMQLTMLPKIQKQPKQKEKSN
jgi:hypothetical protein